MGGRKGLEGDDAQDGREGEGEEEGEGEGEAGDAGVGGFCGGHDDLQDDNKAVSVVPAAGRVNRTATTTPEGAVCHLVRSSCLAMCACAWYVGGCGEEAQTWSLYGSTRAYTPGTSPPSATMVHFSQHGSMQGMVYHAVFPKRGVGHSVTILASRFGQN